MKLLESWITAFAKFFGIQPQTSATTPCAQSAAALIIEKTAVAVVGGGRRPARLRGKHVRMNCDWQVIEQAATTLVLRRSGEAAAGADMVLTTSPARIKKVGAGRRPENLEGLTVRVMTTWTVREDHGEHVVLSVIAP